MAVHSENGPNSTRTRLVRPLAGKKMAASKRSVIELTKEDIPGASLAGKLLSQLKI